MRSAFLGRHLSMALDNIIRILRFQKVIYRINCFARIAVDDRCVMVVFPQIFAEQMPLLLPVICMFLEESEILAV